MRRWTGFTILIILCGIAFGNSGRARAQGAASTSIGVDDLRPVEASPWTNLENWDVHAARHGFGLTNGKTFEIPNPRVRPELAAAYQRFTAMSPVDRATFAQRRRNSLVAIARLFTTGRVVPTKFINSLLEYFDEYMMVSAAAVVHSNDFGLSLTTNVTAGLANSSLLNKRMGNVGKLLGKRGGFYLGSGGGINIGFVPTEDTAYLEVVADFETLDVAVTPLFQLNHAFRAYFYGRAGDQKAMSPIEEGRVSNAPIPLLTGMNTDRGFYLGISGGPSLISFLGPVFKYVILPALDQVATYTTKFKRVHLLRVAVSRGGNTPPVAVDVPILNHPQFASKEVLIASIHEAERKVWNHLNEIPDRILDAWPERESCIITLGLTSRAN